MTFTANETAIFAAFDISTENAEAVIADPVSVCTDVEELAQATFKSIRSTKGIVGSLVRKGFLETTEAGEMGNDTALIPTKAGVQAWLAKDAPADDKSTPAKETKAPAKGNTFTTVDLAEEHGINPKTLRAKIRRNLDKWEPLFKDGEKHVFADNKTTRKKVEALL